MNFFIFLGGTFIIYSFLGWIVENLYCYYKLGRFQNDGFLNGPYKPMYGFAFTLLVLLNSLAHRRLILLLIICLIIPTFIEYITGHILKNFYNKIYWDYSEEPLNFKGLVCAKFSVYWMFLSLMCIYIMEPFINKLFFTFKSILPAIVPFMLLIMVMDFFIVLYLKLKEKNYIVKSNYLNIFSRFKILKKK